MIDVVLTAFVLGLPALAIAVDVGVLAMWVRGRWR
jgi:hypothetical protein